MRQVKRIAIIGLIFFAVEAQKAFTDTVDHWRSPSQAAEKKNPIVADAASIKEGKELFVAACLACHGPAGKGDGPASRGLEKSPADLSAPDLAKQSDGELFWKISNGNSPMPSHAEAMTEKQIWETINYVRTFARKDQSH